MPYETPRTCSARANDDTNRLSILMYKYTSGRVQRTAVRRRRQVQHPFRRVEAHRVGRRTADIVPRCRRQRTPTSSAPCALRHTTCRTNSARTAIPHTPKTSARPSGRPGDSRHPASAPPQSVRTKTQKAPLVEMPFVLRADALNHEYRRNGLFLLREELLYMVVGNDTLLEHIGAGLLRLDQFDALGKQLSRAGFQFCD